MTAISSSIGVRHSRVSRNVTHSLWRDMGIGLAITVVVLTMIALGTHGKSSIQADGSWQGFEISRPDLQIAPSPAPEAFPRRTPADYTVW